MRLRKNTSRPAVHTVTLDSTDDESVHDAYDVSVYEQGRIECEKRGNALLHGVLLDKNNYDLKKTHEIQEMVDEWFRKLTKVPFTEQKLSQHDVSNLRNMEDTNLEKHISSRIEALRTKSESIHADKFDTVIEPEAVEFEHVPPSSGKCWACNLKRTITQKVMIGADPDDFEYSLLLGRECASRLVLVRQYNAIARKLQRRRDPNLFIHRCINNDSLTFNHLVEELEHLDILFGSCIKDTSEYNSHFNKYYRN